MTVKDQIKEIEHQTETLVHWAVNLGLEDIPDPILRKAVLVIGDELGAMAAARKEPEVICIRKQLLRSAGISEATVFLGGQQQTDRCSAAAVNAAAANWCELDEGYRKTACHGGLYALPALLAEAESENASFGEVLRALVVSYEIVTRVARAWKFPSISLHPHALFASLGAAAAVASIRQLDSHYFINALMSAATLINVGPYNHAVKGALIENMWAACAARNGLHSVDWAQCGVAGLKSSLHEVYSVSLGGELNAGAFSKKLGKEWAIADGYHKRFACCQYAHSAVEAAIEVLSDMPAGKDFKDIKNIVVETHELGLTLDNYSPQSSLAARFSLPHIIAATLYFKHAEVEAFGAETLKNSEIEKLRKLIVLKKFEPQKPWPQDRPARVTVDLHGGDSLSAECLSAKGGPDQPFSEEEILLKLSTLTKDIYPAMAPIVGELLTLDEKFIRAPWPKLVADLVTA
jgi:2-methylcitrate dehydratase PrpD